MATRSRTSKSSPAPAPPAATERTLLTAIHDDPDDDARRLAWADWLAAQGNPWGEVVRAAVKLAGKGRPPSPALRAAERRHRAAGLGPLAPLFSDEPGDVTFDRGALAGGVLRRAPPMSLVLDPSVAPRWRGVRWLHLLDGRAPLDLLGSSVIDELTELRNLELGDLPAVAATRSAASLRQLSLFAHEAHLRLIKPELLEPFEAIEQLELHDLTSSDRPDLHRRLYGWLWKSRRARAQLRRLAGLPDELLGEVLRQAPRFAALEAVRTDSVEVVFAQGAAHLFFFGTSAWLEGQIAAMKIAPGAIATLATDARVADRRRDGRASLRALAARLGARLTVHARPTFREHLARWRGEADGPTRIG